MPEPRLRLFTRENAREMGQRGNQAKARLKAERIARDRVREDRILSITANGIDFTSLRLARVRDQLDLIDSAMLTEKDPMKLDRLSAAQLRLSQQEFALAGRPMPGQLRPTAAHARRLQVNLDADFQAPPVPVRQAIAEPVRQVPDLPAAAPGPRAPSTNGALVIGPDSFKRKV